MKYFSITSLVVSGRKTVNRADPRKGLCVTVDIYRLLREYMKGMYLLKY